MNVVLQTQKAIYNLLRNDSTLMELANNVYDFVVVNAIYPYVTIGDGSTVSNSSLGLEGFEISLDINVYSQASGRKEALTIVERIFELIGGQTLAITNYQFVCASFLKMSSQRLNNGDIEAVISFKITLKDNT